MVKQKRKTKHPLKKVVTESFYINEKRGGGMVKIEAWENDKGQVAKYGIAYINHFVCTDDNGRVLGYDNSHGHHHKHYRGEIYPVDDFVSYQDLVERFEQELKEFIK